MSEHQEKEIMSYIQERQFATVSQIASDLYVSPSTVRRKLAKLQRSGFITRTRGGAKINDSSNLLPSFSFRTHQNSLEKKKIAMSATQLIKNGDVIFLDGSTSAFFIAEYLSGFKDIKVITNGLDTLSLLAKNGIDAYSTGGWLLKSSNSALVGEHAINMINRFHADVTFFSAASVTNDGRIYDIFEEENPVRLAMFKNSSKIVFLSDSTKYGKVSPYYICDISNVDYIVSDIDISKKFNSGIKLPEIVY
ncbi:MAG: DeoR/GlpR transcriptional regulator [Clostridia bacterium]|nr:DeoR/GlpR transcriptional regulator [Clostridia bacterium]